MREEAPGEVDHAEVVDLHDAAVGVHNGVGDGAADGDAAVVDQDVHAAVEGDGSLRLGFDVGGVGEVQCED